MSVCHRVLIACVGLSTLLLADAALAQNWGDRLRRATERTVQNEVERSVTRQARQATRCALGDDRCMREARRRGEDVEVVDARGRPASVDPGGDHPLITPYQGSVRRARDYAAFDSYQRIIGVAGNAQSEPLEGTLTRLRYANPQGRSTLELLRNYRDALTAHGFVVQFECEGREGCGTLRAPRWNDVNRMDIGVQRDVRYFTGVADYNDGRAYVSVAVNPQHTFIHVLETTAMQTGLVSVDADALAEGLARDGKVTLDGIHFDTALATLRAESAAALDQAATLLRQQPALRLSVVGHTDNTGDAGANQQLSAARAEAVRQALVERGIAADRLSAQGVGSMAPVASNDTPDGRARNRRVELVQQ